MNEQIKYIYVPAMSNVRCDIIDSRVSEARIKKGGDDFIRLEDKTTGCNLFISSDEMLDFAYLLIEAHFKMFLNDKSTDIEIKINRN